MIYLLGGVIENQNVLFLNKDNSFIGTENKEEAPTMLPNYDEYHAAGTTWSASASIAWMQTQPRIFQFEDLKAVEDALLDAVVRVADSIAVTSLRFTKIKPDTGVVVFKEAQLITENVGIVRPFYTPYE